MPQQFTTDLPDEGQPVLGNGIEDEVAVDRGNATTNYGSVRIQIRETGQSSWDSDATGYAEFVGEYDTLTMEFVGREDGEEYEVRARTETEHVVGAWTDPVSIVTKFPSPTGLTATPQDPTTVLLAWTDQADNETGYRVEERRQYEGGFGHWRELATLAPDTESYEAATSPDTTAEYRVTAYTQYSEATATTTTTVSTQPIGLEPRDVQPSGWHVEITRPDADGVAKPTVLSNVTLNPRLNGKPEVVVPVPYDDQWLDERWERQPARVWRDGERLPVEQLIDTEIERGDNGEQFNLYLRGGHNLNARYQDEVKDRSAHNVMRDVLDASGYAYEVDPAPSTEGELFRVLDADQDFAELAEFDQFSEPLDINNGVEAQQTCYMSSLEDIENAGVDIVSSVQWNWSTNTAIEFDVGSLRSAQWTVDLDYPIPSEHVGFWWRMAKNYEGFVLVSIDDALVSVEVGTNVDENPDKTVEWTQIKDLGNVLTDDEMPDLDAGEHTISIETTSQNPAANQTIGPAGEFWINVPALFDRREWDPEMFTESLDADTRLDGPPGLYSVQTADLRIQPIQRTTGATLDGTFNDTSNEQAIGVGPNEDDIQIATNSTSIDRDFQESTRDFISRLRLGGADGENVTDGPHPDVEQYYTFYRTRPQTITELDIQYDALGSPSITESIDNPIETVLTNKADRANCIWELQWDVDAGEPRVVVTQVGQRESDADPTLAEYSVTKDLGREISGATVYGRTQRQESEQFEAQSIGTQLLNDNIQGGSERVYGDDGTVYESVEESAEGSSGDYEMDYQDGVISVLQEGDMSLIETYNIDYDWHPVGSVERDVDFESHLVRSLSAIRSDAAAQEAASFIVDGLGEPQWEAEVTIPQREAGFDLVDAIAPSQLPTPAGETFEIRSIDESASEVSLTLGARRSAGDVIQQIERSLGETAREV
ncbi:hypothetical protein HALG_00045 [Halorubrum virus CGphi46]|uniref:Fibronectin type-III domain-containing protein n=1 Tax=Halorubrum virus CGphi46 TaxID=754066 RepID=R9TLV2_9CAUD|nr:hypothetical protein HALG_00045 [Halorubrum virus CGphi46]AGN33833.1 hypothetical protein HALG_00045 [Halorubrum virus CGphi46]